MKMILYLIAYYALAATGIAVMLVGGALGIMLSAEIANWMLEAISNL